MKIRELELDEDLLLIELKSGSQIAFRYFYDKYHLQLYRKLLKMVQVDVIAEELLQDLFMKIWQKRELIDPNQSFKAYLYRIGEHIVCDHFRKLAREIKIERELNLNEIDFSEFNEEGPQTEAVQKVINEAINTLPTQQQTVFKLCKIEGKSYEEVSKLLDISHATINTHISRASKRVKEYVIKNHNGTITMMSAYVLFEMIHQTIH
ncbi:RNA polymerase sigma-70 factor, ECF subfamily [Pedobacter sp. ok626]|uniref:RNA polymerase sigma factor n=1 Tax=Pedobacter sp. ok626 TaxID=1761882 RepID=UPI00088280F0|nr:RNA polymerase sigma factor [Pedobacter sp. ok626]SDL22841.1 RNA polymerase sigma-70 factor, ECF subfamily [Pedobacter sp. ok626]